MLEGGSIGNLPALVKTLEEYVTDRDNTVNKLTMALQLIGEAEEIMQRGDQLSLPYDAKPHNSLGHSIREIDERYWRMSFRVTGFNTYMDTEARNRFDKSIETNTPQFNLDNIEATYAQLSNTAGAMFCRGIYNIWKGLCPRYVANQHDIFELPPKIILTGMCTRRWRSDSVEINYSSYRHYGSSQLNDIDRTVKGMAGEKWKSGDLQNAVNAGFLDNENLFEDEFYKIRGFKNGNAHMWIKKASIIRQINGAIEEYCKNAIAYQQA